MPNPTKVIVDCSTGETTEIELTAEEIAQQKIYAIASAERKAQEEAEAQTKAELKASAKAKLVAGEPLTAEEADILII